MTYWLSFSPMLDEIPFTLLHVIQFFSCLNNIHIFEYPDCSAVSTSPDNRGLAVKF